MRVYTTTMDDVGIIHAPEPLEVGDVIAGEHGPPLRVLCVVGFDPGGRVDYVVEAEEARLGLVG